ncbi:MAG: class I SAM-dependent methyltransferase [Bacteroidia bacterium]|nr:class I SAM-dependent methyltransferase [Bacteroidia bacterium]MCF8426345.1 class I SAM-dependent methyltransferase [Bacteroidia bacterium]MCF8445756.1 class I SAM-dependent methyltransferase [Bacteroidia bacterium]
MENLEKCPVCGTEKNNFLLSCKDYVASNESFNIVSCQECTLQYTNPRPSEKEIAKYYQSDKYISHSGSNKSELGVTYKIYDWVRNFSIGQKLNLIKSYHKGGNLLDLGCGLGYFLNGVKIDNTFNAEGADISEEAINYVKKTFDIEVISENKLDSISKESYDIITQWHVMEHVHRLDERMVFLKKVLKKSGTMFIAVPISNSFDAKHYKAFWDGYDVPRHLYHFNSTSFIKLMEKHGFKVIQQKAMLFDAPYISMRSEYHQNNKFGFLKGLFYGTISIINAWFTNNYSSILFVVKHK